jgi:hypothetical protein
MRIEEGRAEEKNEGEEAFCGSLVENILVL